MIARNLETRILKLEVRRMQQNRPWKVVKVRRGFKEDPDVARDRHYAAHPEDRNANIVIYKFYDEDLESPPEARGATVQA